jgi:hypothetical protein
VPGWWEVYPEQRIDPRLARTIPSQGYGIPARACDVVCYAYSPAFPERPLSYLAIAQDPDSARGALLDERTCKDWCDYKPGHDPKDHLMHRRVELLEEDRRRSDATLNRVILVVTFFGILLTAIQTVPDRYRDAVFKYWENLILPPLTPTEKTSRQPQAPPFRE